MSRKGGLAIWWKSRNLNSLKGEERLQAVEKLASLGSQEAVPLLTETLSDSLTALRAAAAAALGELGDDRAIRPMINLMLHEQVSEVRHQCATSLAKLNREQTAEGLLSALDDHEINVSQAAAWALRTIAWDDLPDAQRARVAVIQSDWGYAAKLGRPAIPALCEALRNGTQRSRRDAVEALAQIGSREAFSAVVGVLRDAAADPGARKAAAWSLRQYVWPGLGDADLALSAIVLGDWAAIESLGLTAAAPLTSALQDRCPQIRERAAEALGRLKCEESVDALILALSDSHQDLAVRTIAAQSLGTFPGDRQLPALAKALTVDGWPIRRAAAESLSKTNWQPKDDTQRTLFAIAQKRWDEVTSIGPAAARPLVSVLKYHAVSGEAARALIRLGTPGVDAMVETLQDANADMAVREVASTVLAEVGDRRAIGPLHEMLSGPDIAVRHAAVWALERLDWEAQTDHDRVLVAIARDEWTQVRNFGPPASRPLLNMLASSLAVEEAASALEQILEATAGRSEETDLREMAVLGDQTIACDDDSTQQPQTQRISCARIRRLAESELARRGFLQ